jgi:hypothetical protein
MMQVRRLDIVIFFRRLAMILLGKYDKAMKSRKREKHITRARGAGIEMQFVALPSELFLLAKVV